ncbi:hypothetical protein MPER_10233, partial [Moniliophthora perniciosa FA553]
EFAMDCGERQSSNSEQPIPFRTAHSRPACKDNLWAALLSTNKILITIDYFRYFPLTVTMSPQVAFPNASDFKITGNAMLSNVGGNQYNFRTTIVGRNGGAVVHKRRKGSDRYSQFHEIIRGDMFMLQEIHSEEIHDWEVGDEGYVRPVSRGRRTICTAELSNAKESKYTVMTYQGQDARKLWKKDFREYSQSQAPHRLQLFAINQSDIPALIFYNDHFFKGSLWMAVYIKCLKTKYMCSKRDLWMDASKGIIVQGPHGPYVNVSLSDFAVEVAPNILPSTVDMLRADTCARYLSKRMSDMFRWITLDPATP